jgi:hypothetical protein
MGAAIEQQGPRAVVVLYPLRNQGDWHISLDRPEDGLFSARDLRLRLELAGQETDVRQLAAGQYELRAGSHRAVIHTLPGRFDGQPIQWESGRADGQAVVDGVCYLGPARTFDFRALTDVVVGAGVELLSQEQAIAPSPPTLRTAEPARVELAWNVEPELAVSASFAPSSR